MLRAFCLRLLLRHPDYSVQLDVFEEGYMKVDLFLAAAKIGELYVFDDMKGEPARRYALYLLFGNDEEEYYFDEVAEGLRYMPGGSTSRLDES